MRQICPRCNLNESAKRGKSLCFACNEDREAIRDFYDNPAGRREMLLRGALDTEIGAEDD